jgi:hypothetical protein
VSDIKMEDVTGQPRSNRDVEEALAYVSKQIVTDPMAMSKDGVPRTIHYIVIRAALQELLDLRRIVETAAMDAAKKAAGL